MAIQIVLNYFYGLIIGYLLELAYRSFQDKKLIKPIFINLQMYGLAGIILFLIYRADVAFYYKILSIFFITTGIELIVGSLYLKYKKIKLWDYSHEFMNYKGIICLRFSVYWLIASLIYLYLVLPYLDKLLR